MKSAKDSAKNANKFRAIAIATFIADASDASAIALLDTLERVHSAAFIESVYETLDVLA